MGPGQSAARAPLQGRRPLPSAEPQGAVLTVPLPQPCRGAPAQTPVGTCTRLQPELCDFVCAKCKLLMNREAGQRAAEQANKEHDWWKSRQDSESSFSLRLSLIIPLKTADSTHNNLPNPTQAPSVCRAGVSPAAALLHVATTGCPTAATPG